MALAKIDGLWVEEPSEAMLVGSYVHAAVEGGDALDILRYEHPEMFKKDGKLKSTFEKAEEMIHTLESDDMIQFFLQGRKEVPIVARFAGAWWKAKIDVLNERNFADIKTVKAIREKYWDKHYGWVTFVESFGYLRQMALYAELERIASGRKEWLEPLIIAVSKEDIPDKEIIGLDQSRMQMELGEIKEHMPRIKLVKSRREEPRRCERCKYCRSTKKLGHIVHYMDLLAE